MNLFTLKSPSLLVMSLLLFTAFLLMINYNLGSQSIKQAQLQQFGNNPCESCTTCGKQPSTCKEEQQGFDNWYLLGSFYIQIFTVSMILSARGSNLIKGLNVSSITGIGFLLLTEAIVRLFQIPVLHTGFPEGWQFLYYRFLSFDSINSFKDIIMFLIIVFTTVSIVGLIGYVVGSVFRLSIGKITHLFLIKHK